MNRPNFFIVGAPKCGTTALSEYLRDHPEVCFARPKEPYHFLTDLPGYDPGLTDQEYLRNFFGHCDDATAVGEGSVFYLLSREAVDNILRFNPQSRFIVMLRDPADLVYAFHRQLLYNYSEDVTDFRKAWRLQKHRRAGRRIPPKCREPRLLQYREVGALGSQLERLLQRVPESRVHVIFFDDFSSATSAVYEDTIRFLGLRPDGREDFPRINPSKEHQFRPLARLTQRVPAPLVEWGERVKQWLGIERLGIIPALRDWNTRVSERQPLDSDFRERLAAEFEPEVEKLERLTGRDLADWKTSGEA